MYVLIIVSLKSISFLKKIHFISVWMVSLTKGMMEARPFKNGIMVDYGPLCCNYLEMANIVSQKMGEYITKNFSKVLDLKPESMVMAGHSLGAHIAGYSGASFQNQNLGSLDTIFGK